LNKLKQRENNIEGTRQNRFVTSEEGTHLNLILSVSLKRGRRLFIKNTGLCKFLRRRIKSDSCPVLQNEISN